MFDFLFWKNRALVAEDALILELRRQITHRDTLIADLREENAQLRGKVDRMELVLLPQTTLGSLYHRSLVPSVPAPPRPTSKALENPVPYISNWERHKQQWIEEQAELDRAEEAARKAAEAAKKKENSNGVQVQ